MRFPIVVADCNNSKLGDTMVHSESDERANRLSDKAALGEAGQPVRYNVADLLRGGREAILEHDGAEYRLRITANGRLILTK